MKGDGGSLSKPPRAVSRLAASLCRTLVFPPNSPAASASAIVPSPQQLVPLLGEAGVGTFALRSQAESARRRDVVVTAISNFQSSPALPLRYRRQPATTRAG